MTYRQGSRPTRVLCVCEHGHTRAAAAAFFLNRRGGTEAIAASARYQPLESLAELCGWADHVIVLERDILPSVNEAVESLAQPWAAEGDEPPTVVVWDVGPDRWFRLPDEELSGLIRERFESVGL